MDDTKKRWLSLFVENDIGVLAKISGLFSSKLYNLDSLTVGVTEDPTISRMTIGLTSDDKTFEQITKQLNRCVEVIKVIDFTDIPTHSRELLFIKVNRITEADKMELFRITSVYPLKMVDYNKNTAILQAVEDRDTNNELVKLLSSFFINRIEVVRGGSVAIESFF
ncbi:MAG TPA: acetolactate synthase small subunit [Clostridiaceae bacterium]|nr:acetolactate synthase small subunit [Clostridiaceae bacterium]